MICPTLALSRAAQRDLSDTTETPPFGGWCRRGRGARTLEGRSRPDAPSDRVRAATDPICPGERRRRLRRDSACRNAPDGAFVPTRRTRGGWSRSHECGFRPAAIAVPCAGDVICPTAHASRFALRGHRDLSDGRVIRPTDARELLDSAHPIRRALSDAAQWFVRRFTVLCPTRTVRNCSARSASRRAMTHDFEKTCCCMNQQQPLLTSSVPARRGARAVRPPRALVGASVRQATDIAYRTPSDERPKGHQKRIRVTARGLRRRSRT